jgi:DNA-binding protein YbaB
MKLSIVSLLALSLGSASAFAPSVNNVARTSAMQRNMFSGAGEATPKEDEEGQLAEMEKVAKAMGMSLEEYQLGMNARMRMEKEIADLRITSGDDLVKVERCGNSPPQHLVITVSDEGKALGKKALEEKLLAALKDAGDQSKKGREKAQGNMMQFIGDQMKAMGGQ